jgi:hypothetical protein
MSRSSEISTRAPLAHGYRESDEDHRSRYPAFAAFDGNAAAALDVP